MPSSSQLKNVSSEGVAMSMMNSPSVWKRVTDIPISIKWPMTLSQEGSVCRFFTRYPTAVECVCFSPDGLWLAVGRGDGQIDLYDAIDEILLMSLPGGKDRSARGLHFIKSHQHAHPKGLPSLFYYRLFSTGLHGLITEWSLINQKAIREISSYGGAIFASDHSDKLGLLITASDDGSIRLFKIRANASVRFSDICLVKNSQMESRRSQNVTNVSEFDQSEAGSEESQTEPSPGTEELTFWRSMTKHHGRLLSCCLYEDKWLFGGTADSKVLRWQLSTGTADAKMCVNRSVSLSHDRNKRQPEQSQETLVWSLIALPNQGHLISGDSLGNIIIWDVNTTTSIKVFRPHEADVLGFAAKANDVYSVGIDGRLCMFVYSTTGTSSEWLLSGSKQLHESEIRSVSLSCRGTVATGASDTQVAILMDPHSLSSRRTFLPSFSSLVANSWVLYCESLQLVVTILPSCLDVWCLVGDAENRPNKLMQGKSKRCRQIEFKPVKIATLELNDDGPWCTIRCAALSSDGSLIAVSNDMGTRLFRFDINELTIETINSQKLKQQVASALTFCSPQANGSFVLLVGSVATVKGKLKNKLLFWDVDSMSITKDMTNIDSAIQHMKLSNDCQWLSLRTISGSVILYSLDLMQVVFRFPKFPISRVQQYRLNHSNTINSPSVYLCGPMAFSPNNKYLCVSRLSCGMFFLYNTIERRLLEHGEIHPQLHEPTRPPGMFPILGIENESNRDIGEVIWLTSKPKKPSSLSDTSPLKYLELRPDIPLETLIVKTRTLVCSHRFQLIDDGPTPGKYKRLREELTPPADALLAGKKHPARALLQSNLGDIIHIVVNTRKCSQDDVFQLILFSQDKTIPAAELPNMFQRKKYATAV